MRQVELGPEAVGQFLSEERLPLLGYYRILELPHKIVEAWEANGTRGDIEAHLFDIFEAAERDAYLSAHRSADEQFIEAILGRYFSEILQEPDLLLIAAHLEQVTDKVSLLSKFHEHFTAALSDERGQMMPSLDAFTGDLYNLAMDSVSGYEFISSLLFNELEPQTRQIVESAQRDMSGLTLQVLSNRQLQTKWALSPSEQSLWALLQLENQQAVLKSVDRHLYQIHKSMVVTLNGRKERITRRWVWRKEQELESMHDLLSRALLIKLVVEDEFPQGFRTTDELITEVKHLGISSVYHQLLNQQTESGKKHE